MIAVRILVRPFSGAYPENIREYLVIAVGITVIYL